jgi:hypothetical protein
MAIGAMSKRVFMNGYRDSQAGPAENLNINRRIVAARA